MLKLQNGFYCEFETGTGWRTKTTTRCKLTKRQVCRKPAVRSTIVNSEADRQTDRQKDRQTKIK